MTLGNGDDRLATRRQERSIGRAQRVPYFLERGRVCPRRGKDDFSFSASNRFVVIADQSPES